MDIGAAGVVAALLLLPSPVRPVEATYTAGSAQFLPRIAEAQAEAARRPESGEAAADLIETLMWADQSDWAARAGGHAGAVDNKAPDRWRALWALSKVHAERIEIEPAYRWAKLARDACEQNDACCRPSNGDCFGPDWVFLNLRVVGFEACIATGVDPKMNWKACDEAVRRVTPTIKAKPPEAPAPAPAAPK
jgi:hypothetical protein